MARAASPIPPGCHTVTPHLNVQGADKSIEFLKTAFGGVELRRSPGAGGKLMHAVVQIGNSTLMMADDFAAEFNLPFAQGRLPLVLNLYVTDADAVWAKALAAGCEVVYPIGDQNSPTGRQKLPAGAN